MRCTTPRNICAPRSPSHPDKSEADVLELIASTYGAPEEVAAAYRDTEIKVAAALRTPREAAALQRARPVLRHFSAIARAYAGLLFMLFSLATGILYFTVTVIGPVAVAGPRDPHHRRSILHRVHRRDPRARAGGMPAGREP